MDSDKGLKKLEAMVISENLFYSGTTPLTSWQDLTTLFAEATEGECISDYGIVTEVEWQNRPGKDSARQKAVYGYVNELLVTYIKKKQKCCLGKDRPEDSGLAKCTRDIQNEVPRKMSVSCIILFTFEII